ncbi:MAG: hypothetical protein FJY75_10860 [Candidatus Eisenbacteria bacterium]|uniref:Fibronectin type-III domain-containing protein n=1 Tax=Eiseniibacteriota bacterium TaxID=2212470 RepID=A0A937X9E6_UNCEI|nr:hypothetical protein [Candidatus Eisenbacteria bacterium]
MTQRTSIHWSAAAPAVLALLAITAAGGFTGCDTETEAPNFANPLDPALGADLPVPDSLSVAVGDHTVRLAWRLPPGEAADEYAVFRRRIDADTPEPERLLDRIPDRAYTDRGVRSGRVYAYRVAAGAGGRFGPRTEEIEARPGLFTISIAGNDEVTRDREVFVAYAVPGAEAVRLSEEPDRFTEPWRAATGQASWMLSPGDGLKTLYARFRLEDASETLPVFDTIRLDTRAVIESFSFDGSRVRAPGEVIRFRMVTGEPHGQARVTVGGVFASVPLFDDGSAGDATAGDGIYERDLTIPPGASVENEAARGSFVDLAGNTATEVSAPLLLTVRRLPLPVALLPPEVADPPDAPSATLRWSYSSESAFQAYRIYRAESAPVDSTSELAGSVTRALTLDFEDSGVTEGRRYHYRVYVQDHFGRESGSNAVEALIPNLRPPKPVTLRAPNAVSTSRIALDWTESAERDFRVYRLYRNTTGAVADDDPLLVEIDDRTTTSWDDAGLRENTRYYYRVYVVDQGGLTARSNEVEARTRNEAPAAVTLHAATAIDSTAATLSWSESQAHDFAFYRLYRDEIPTVTTGSTRAVELDQRTFTSFRDTELESGKRYYYRVFVVDEGDDAKATGSNTITLETP